MRVDEITEQREQLNEWVPIAIWGGRILYTALGRLGAKQFIKKYGKKSYDWVQKQTKKPETVKSNPVKPNLKAVDKLPKGVEKSAKQAADDVGQQVEIQGNVVRVIKSNPKVAPKLKVVPKADPKVVPKKKPTLDKLSPTIATTVVPTEKLPDITITPDRGDPDSTWEPGQGTDPTPVVPQPVIPQPDPGPEVQPAPSAPPTRTPLAPAPRPDVNPTPIPGPGPAVNPGPTAPAPPKNNVPRIKNKTTKRITPIITPSDSSNGTSTDNPMPLLHQQIRNFANSPSGKTTLQYGVPGIKRGAEVREARAERKADRDAFAIANEIGYTKAEWDAYTRAIAKKESYGGKYTAIGTKDPQMLGKYQMSDGARADAAGRLGITNPTYTQFINNPALQERMFAEWTKQNYQTLVQNSSEFAQMNRRDQQINLARAQLGATNLVGALAGGPDKVDGLGTKSSEFATQVRDEYNIMDKEQPQTYADTLTKKWKDFTQAGPKQHPRKLDPQQMAKGVAQGFDTIAQTAQDYAKKGYDYVAPKAKDLAKQSYDYVEPKAKDLAKQSVDTTKDFYNASPDKTPVGLIKHAGSEVADTLSQKWQDFKTSASDFVSQDAAKKRIQQTTNEKAPPGDKSERMVKDIKKGYTKDGKLTKQEKSIAYATAWKLYNKRKGKKS